MERFWSKTAPDGGCVVWTAGTRRDGYGVFSLGGRMRAAHRVAWGEKHHATPLTVKDVQTIRVAAAEGTSQAALARRYGVSPPALSKIVRRLTWRHVA